MLDVVVAVPEALRRLGIEASLRESDVARVVAALDSVDTLDAVLEEHQPNVLILDVRFRRDDPELIRGLTTRHPSCRVLVLVPHKAQECALRNLLSGGGPAHLSPGAASRIDECCLTSLKDNAHGCLACEASSEEVIQTVAAVAAGQVAAASWLSAFADVGLGNGQRRPTITARELEVMALLAKGLGNKAIGRALGIREQTVKNHLARLMSKMGLTSRSQVGLVALRYHVRVKESKETKAE